MKKTIHSEEYKEIIKQLVTARKDANITQQQLAKKLSRQQSYIAKYENRERRLDVVELVEISKALGIKASNLIKMLEDN